MFDDLRSAYIGLYARLRQEGHWVPNGTFEMQHAHVTVRNPIQPVIPLSAVKFNRRYFALEFMAHIQADNSYDRMVEASKVWHGHSDDGKTLNSVYGSTIQKYGGWDFVINTLREDPENRKCYLPLFHPEHAKVLKDNPCNVGIHFLQRQGRLHCHLMARSIDMCLGMPVDWAFTIIMQYALAWCLGLSVGYFSHSISSLHVYERDFHDWLAYDFNIPDDFDRLLPMHKLGLGLMDGIEDHWDGLFRTLKGKKDSYESGFETRIKLWSQE